MAGHAQARCARFPDILLVITFIPELNGAGFQSFDQFSHYRLKVMFRF